MHCIARAEWQEVQSHTVRAAERPRRLPATRISLLVRLEFATIHCANGYGRCVMSQNVRERLLLGSEFAKIAEVNLLWPNSMAVDPYSDRIFVADNHLNVIEYMNIDGSNRHRVGVQTVKAFY